MAEFDADRAILKGVYQFKRFNVNGDGIALRHAGIDPQDELIVFERAGERRGLLKKRMIYHHVAQGELAGEPYLVSF